MNVAAKPRSRAKIREITRNLRRTFGVENEYRFPVLQFVEWILANPDNGINIEILEPKEMIDTYSTMNTGKNVISIREDVYNRAVNGDPRDLFTLCHEIGHYFLHRPDSVSFARGDVPTYMDPEWQANTFAAELMAPYYLIKNLHSVEEVMERCGMSRQAAEIQFYQCRKIV